MENPCIWLGLIPMLVFILITGLTYAWHRWGKGRPDNLFLYYNKDILQPLGMLIVGMPWMLLMFMFALMVPK